MYPLSTALGAPALGLLVALLLSGLGVIASLKATTVRQAAQSLSLVFLVFVLAALLVIDLIVLTVASAKSRRSRLILE